MKFIILIVVLILEITCILGHASTEVNNKSANVLNDEEPRQPKLLPIDFNGNCELKLGKKCNLAGQRTLIASKAKINVFWNFSEWRVSEGDLE